MGKPGTEKKEKTAKPERSALSIAFVCFGNACRSQMAEAWARHLGGEKVVAQSAGVHPLGEVTPETQAVMAEKGLSLDRHYSKGMDAIDWARVDLLVNMSPYALHRLPGFSGRVLTWRVPDPFQQPLATYRRVRDDLARRVRSLLGEARALAPPGKTL